MSVHDFQSKIYLFCFCSDGEKKGDDKEDCSSLEMEDPLMNGGESFEELFGRLQEMKGYFHLLNTFFSTSYYEHFSVNTDYVEKNQTTNLCH